MSNEKQETISAILAAPARNCDVGTVEEQSERYHALCDSFKCPSCPWKFGKTTDCALNWAQMPYEEVKWCTHVREVVVPTDETCELFEPKSERSDKNEDR